MMQIRTVALLLLPLLLTAFLLPPDFLEEQKKYPRVNAALQEKGQAVIGKLASEKLRPDQVNILLVAYKAERQLELYAKGSNETIYKKIMTHKICSSSGVPGPKSMQGDFQVPEGFYHIDRFHPESSFHLSLGINYPNTSDRRRSTAKSLGGDIFIHGGCLSSGCLAMTDDKIKELYLYAVLARQSGQQKIPVYLFPFYMTDHKMQEYKNRYHKNEALLSFWANLKTGYDKFDKEKQELRVAVDSKGNYTF